MSDARLQGIRPTLLRTGSGQAQRHKHGQIASRLWRLARTFNRNNMTHPPPALTIEAVNLMVAGKDVLILAPRPMPEVDVRTALLQALDLFTTPQDMAGHA